MSVNHNLTKKQIEELNKKYPLGWEWFNGRVVPLTAGGLLNMRYLMKHEREIVKPIYEKHKGLALTKEQQIELENLVAKTINR